MNGEQRPYWLYYNEMDYIISHFPGHRPRINLDASNSVSATSTPNSANTSLDGSTTASNANQTEFADIKPTRLASISAVNMDASKCKKRKIIIIMVNERNKKTRLTNLNKIYVCFLFVFFLCLSICTDNFCPNIEFCGGQNTKSK